MAADSTAECCATLSQSPYFGLSRGFDAALVGAIEREYRTPTRVATNVRWSSLRPHQPMKCGDVLTTWEASVRCRCPISGVPDGRCPPTVAAPTAHGDVDAVASTPVALWRAAVLSGGGLPDVGLKTQVAIAVQVATDIRVNVSVTVGAGVEHGTS